jgi:predicted ATP-grasp superfamily ATP-dependent carboligase
VKKPSSIFSAWTNSNVPPRADFLAWKSQVSEKRVSLTSAPAIVTYAKNRIAYNITRSLGQRGVPVYTADSLPWAMSYSSIHSRGHFQYPSPFSRQEQFIDCLVKRAEALPGCVLIPAFEETFLISKHKDRFRGLARMAIPDYDQILTAHNKDRWEALARSLRIPVPGTCQATDLRNGKKSFLDMSYPLLVKPKQGGGAWGISQVDSPEELERFLFQRSNNGIDWGRFFCQEIIEGETHCVAMLFCRGQLRAKVAYRQLRDYPISGGQATLRVSIRSEVAEHYLQNLLEHLKWHGVCQADFVVDRRTRIPYLIDVNPRFWGSLVQAIASGVDFPFMLYRIAVEGDVEQVQGFKTGISTRWLGGDLRTLLPLLKRAPSKRKFAEEFFLPLNKATLYDDFSWKDPLPIWVWAFDAVFRIIKNRSLEPKMNDSLEGVWE